MQRHDAPLITPIYVKHSDKLPPPQDPVYYLLTADNLYLCRNHSHYQSCVPAPMWPTELFPHRTSVVPNYPPIPQTQLEQICGFFSHMSEQYGAEAIALLAWDQNHHQVHTVVPRQISAVSQAAWGPPCPIAVKYQLPRDLPDHWSVFGDIHSHCELGAYASQTDVDDECAAAGLHLVVGRLQREPPDFHVELAVDGTRFPLKWEDVVTGYHQRREFPPDWLDQIAVTNYATFRTFDFDGEPRG